MLVLSRRVGQKIMIDDDIEIEVLRLSGGAVKLGIKAPKEIRVLRTELLEKERSMEIFETLEKNGATADELAELAKQYGDNNKWHEHVDNRVGLGGWLDAEGMFDGTTSVLAFFEKPWKWDREYWCWQLWLTRDVQNDPEFMEFVVTRMIEGKTAGQIDQEWSERQLVAMGTYDMMTEKEPSDE